MDRKVQSVLNNETGFVPKKKSYVRPVSSKTDEEELKKPALSMTGLKASAELEQLGAGSKRMASITQYLKNLDTQLLVMQRTDDDLIARIKQQEKEKQEIERRH